MMLQLSSKRRVRNLSTNSCRTIQSLGNVKMKFVRAFSIEEMRKML
jgi:uncharacterized protein with GYD domain